MNGHTWGNLRNKLFIVLWKGPFFYRKNSRLIPELAQVLDKLEYALDARPAGGWKIVGNYENAPHAGCPFRYHHHPLSAMAPM